MNIKQRIVEWLVRDTSMGIINLDESTGEEQSVNTTDEQLLKLYGSKIETMRANRYKQRAWIEARKKKLDPRNKEDLEILIHRYFMNAKIYIYQDILVDFQSMTAGSIKIRIDKSKYDRWKFYKMMFHLLWINTINGNWTTSYRFEFEPYLPKQAEDWL